MIAGPLAFSIYVLLRSWMDEAMGVVGVSRPISMRTGDVLRNAYPQRKGGDGRETGYEQIRTALAA